MWIRSNLKRSQLFVVLLVFTFPPVIATLWMAVIVT